MPGCSLKEKAGALLYDLPRFLRCQMGFPGHSWMFMRNRDERLVPDARGIGVRCDWQWTSDLHLAKVFPALGRHLMKRAMEEWPVNLRRLKGRGTCEPEISFIIGHRGNERLPHLAAALDAIAGQEEVSWECLVVEQASLSQLDRSLPESICHIHTVPPDGSMPYCRSWAFNVGARRARGRVLVFHDNDILPPAGYGREIMRRYHEGYEVINLKRFIFYLSPADTGRVFSTGTLSPAEAPEAVMQNAEGGGSIAVAREAFLGIGGFDEQFVGWGGEDNEFWERAQTLRVWPYGYLPLVHLWHESQPNKFNRVRSTAALFQQRSAIPVPVRIRELTARNFGSPVQPDPPFKGSS